MMIIPDNHYYMLASGVLLGYFILIAYCIGIKIRIDKIKDESLIAVNSNINDIRKDIENLNIKLTTILEELGYEVKKPLGDKDENINN